MKKQLKENQKECKIKSLEIEQLKKNIKNTKNNELILELKNLNEEFTKLKCFYEISFKNNQEKEKYLKDYVLLQDVFAKQNNQLFFLNDGHKKLDEEIKIKDEEILNLKNLIKQKDNKMSKFKKDLQYQILIKEKIEKQIQSQPDANTLQNKIGNLEKKISELKRDCKFYKSDSE